MSCDLCDGSGVIPIWTEDGSDAVSWCHMCPTGLTWKEVGLE